jgi:hypothetical protein
MLKLFPTDQLSTEQTVAHLVATFGHSSRNFLAGMQTLVQVQKHRNDQARKDDPFIDKMLESIGKMNAFLYSLSSWAPEENSKGERIDLLHLIESADEKEGGGLLQMICEGNHPILWASPGEIMFVMRTLFRYLRESAPFPNGLHFLVGIDSDFTLCRLGHEPTLGSPVRRKKGELFFSSINHPEMEFAIQLIETILHRWGVILFCDKDSIGRYLFTLKFSTEQGKGNEK